MVPGGQIIGFKIFVEPVLDGFHEYPFRLPAEGGCSSRQTGKLAFSIDRPDASIRQKARSDGIKKFVCFTISESREGFKRLPQAGLASGGRSTTLGADLPNSMGNKVLGLFEDIAKQNHLSLTA
jgi:hypothetical protein